MAVGPPLSIPHRVLPLARLTSGRKQPLTLESNLPILYVNIDASGGTKKHAQHDKKQWTRSISPTRRSVPSTRHQHGNPHPHPTRRHPWRPRWQCAEPPHTSSPSPRAEEPHPRPCRDPTPGAGWQQTTKTTSSKVRSSLPRGWRIADKRQEIKTPSRQLVGGQYLVHGGKTCGGVLERLSAAEVVDGGNRHGHASAQDLQVGLGDLLDGVRRGAVAARIHHVRLQHRAFHEHAVIQHGLVQARLHRDVHVHGSLQVMDALQRDVRLHDGHEALVLGDERKAGKILPGGTDGAWHGLGEPFCARQAHNFGIQRMKSKKDKPPCHHVAGLREPWYR
eukprot:scaffold7362_cov266-Pinguiococcus_pyrenoidosus.AAC.8